MPYLTAAANNWHEEFRKILTSAWKKMSEEDNTFAVYLKKIIDSNVQFIIAATQTIASYEPSTKQIVFREDAAAALLKITDKSTQHAILQNLFRHEGTHAFDHLQLTSNDLKQVSDAENRLSFFADLANSLFNTIHCITKNKQINPPILDKLTTILPSSARYTRLNNYVFESSIAKEVEMQATYFGSFPVQNDESIIKKYFTNIYQLGSKLFFEETCDIKKAMELYQKTAEKRKLLNNYQEFEKTFESAIDRNFLKLLHTLNPKQLQVFDTLLLIYSTLTERFGIYIDECMPAFHACVKKQQQNCINVSLACQAKTPGDYRLTVSHFEIHAMFRERSKPDSLTPQLLEELCPANKTPTKTNPPLTHKNITNNATQNTIQHQDQNPINIAKPPEEKPKSVAQENNEPTLLNTAFNSFITGFCDTLIGELLKQTNLQWWQQKIIQHTLSTALFLLLGSSLTSLLLPKAILFLLEQVMKYIGINNVTLYGYKIDVLNSVLIASQFTSFNNITSVAVSFVSSTCGFFAAQKTTPMLVSNPISKTNTQ